MPYQSISDLPAGVRDALPAGAQEIFRAAFNAAYDPPRCGDDCAAKIAWSAVGQKYEKSGDTWTAIGNAAHATTLQRLGVYLKNDGKDVLYSPDRFAASVPAWSGVPLIFHDPGTGVLRHPAQDAVTADNLPAGYRKCGSVTAPAISSAGEPALEAILDIDDPALSARASAGELSISTGFSTSIAAENDGRYRIVGDVVPNHVLLFPRGGCPNCFPNDHGAIICNCIPPEDDEMDDESKGLLKKIADALTKPSVATQEDMMSTQEITNAAELSAEKEKAEKLTAENARLSAELAEFKEKAEQEKRDQVWAAFRNAIPAGWLGDKEAETRKEFETAPSTFTLKLIAFTNANPGTVTPAEGNAKTPGEPLDADNAAEAEIRAFEEKYKMKFID